MKKLAINPSNKKYYSDDYIKGWENGVNAQYEATKDAVEVVRCKDCKHRHEDECPMYWEEQIDIDEGDGYYDTEYIIHDYTQDDGFCSWGERMSND